MKYYLHDTDSFNDEKVTELYIKFGYEGLGLFYTLLEKIAKQEKPIKTEILKHQLKVGKRLNKCWLFMEQLGLVSSNNGETFNKQLLNFSEKYQVKKEKNRKRISEWRDKQVDKENVTRSESVSNIPKVKESKVKESKSVKHLFENSPFFDLKLLQSDIGVKYQKYDIPYYHESAKIYSESKGAMYKNWKAAIQGFIRRDESDGKAKLKKQKSKLEAI